MTALQSIDPASGALLWEGAATTADECRDAIAKARLALPAWSALPVDDRRAMMKRYQGELRARADIIATDISRETGKPLWEAKTEVATMIGKVDLSIAAQDDRAGERRTAMPFGEAVLRHRPHGVMVVLGPYNFPGHLPNGHIVPALLAGDTIVFKPSELTPLIGTHIAECLAAAALPEGVFTLVQGGRDTGAALIDCDIDGLLFTGSSVAGMHFRKIMAERPKVMLALELGGNNPLIAWDGDPDAAAALIVQSAFITAGQRCTCARRLIVPDDDYGRQLVTAVLALMDQLLVGAWDDDVEAFMGPLISSEAATVSLMRQKALIERGAVPVRPMAPISGRSGAFLTAGLIDVTDIEQIDEEIFAPLLQLIRVPDFDAAITAAEDTTYGLAAGLISENTLLWNHFRGASRAGVLNLNRPTTGASGALPFGGSGASGNHRPSAYYAADYCAYPVASLEAPKLANLLPDIKGLRQRLQLLHANAL